MQLPILDLWKSIAPTACCINLVQVVHQCCVLHNRGGGGGGQKIFLSPAPNPEWWIFFDRFTSWIENSHSPYFRDFFFSKEAYFTTKVVKNIGKNVASFLVCDEIDEDEDFFFFIQVGLHVKGRIRSLSFLSRPGPN